MLYVTSDLHGYPLDDFLKLLQSVNFSEDDYLFVLGDVIDRGREGAELLRWMSLQPNVQLILGNHELMLLSCSFLFDELTEDNAERLTADKMDLVSNWIFNGAAPTLTGLRQILKNERDIFDGILEYLQDAPLYEIVDVNGKSFVLVHAGLDNFDPELPLDDYSREDLTWARPSMDTQYFTDGTTVIFGHTPTERFDACYKGKILMHNGWICIDPGTALGNDPFLLRLDDLQAFYLPKD